MYVLKDELMTCELYINNAVLIYCFNNVLHYMYYIDNLSNNHMIVSLKIFFIM